MGKKSLLGRLQRASSESLLRGAMLFSGAMFEQLRDIPAADEKGNMSVFLQTEMRTKHRHVSRADNGTTVGVLPVVLDPAGAARRNEMRLMHGSLSQWHKSARPEEYTYILYF